MGRSIKIIFLILEKSIVIAAAVALLLSLICSSISQDKYPWLFIFGYGLFFLYCLNLIILLWQAVRLSFWSFVPFVLLVIGFNDFSGHYPISALTKYAPTQKSIKIISYNVRGFRDNNWHLTTDSLIHFINGQKADIIALQEAEGNLSIDSLKNKLLGMSYICNSEPNIGSQITIFSRFPLIRSRTINFAGTFNRAQYCDVIVNVDTIRLFNMHLQTTGIDRDERLLLSKESITATPTIDSIEQLKLKTIYNKVVESNRLRAHQVDSIAPIIAQSPYPVLICGDFNDVLQSYAYKTLSRGLIDSFKEAGEGYGHTFNDFFNLLKIDFILYSEQYKALTYNSPHLRWSDHNPIIVTLAKRQ